MGLLVMEQRILQNFKKLKEKFNEFFKINKTNFMVRKIK